MNAPGSVAEVVSDSTVLEFALRYAAAGRRVLPLHTVSAGRCSCERDECRTPGKHPRTEHGAHDASTDADAIGAWWRRWPDANIGMALDGLVVVDVDPRNGGDAELLPHALPDTCTQRTGSRGAHHVYRAVDGARYPGRLIDGIDLKHGPNAYIVVEPSVHASGERYCWLDESEPWSMTPAHAPEWLARASTVPPPQQDVRDVARLEDATKVELRSALASMRADDRDLWVRMGHALKTAGDAGRALWLEWSMTSEKYDAADAARVWDSFQPSSTDHRAVFAEAQRVGWVNPRAQVVGPAAVSATMDAPAILDASSDVLVDVNQDNVALIFAKRFGDDLRFSHDRGRWYQWVGSRWKEETTRLAFDYTRSLTRALNKEGKREFAKASFCEGVEKFAQADRTFAMTGREWDADPRLLNTPDGTVDLRTGTTRPAQQADLLTKLTAVSPRARPAAKWLEFLKQVTQGDEAMIGFLQRMAGYALTGDTREECLFFVYGPGGNGKGTFIGAVFDVLAEYAVNAAMDVFLQSKNERHTTDLAMLRGARLVTASETSEGRAWDEQRLKAMTGNDPITARFMRQDNFTYVPQFKLILIGNNKPVLRTVDDAWRRRFHVIPFTFTPRSKDTTLKARLRTEYPEILHWCIEGCLDWQRGGLRPPERVQNETAAYFETQDIFTSWVEDCCETGPAVTSLTSELFSSWSSYCDRHHEPAGTSRTFSDRLASRGYRRIRNQHGLSGRGFIGIKVVPFSHLEPS